MGNTDKLGKLLSLFFAMTATVMFIGVGISLSYRNLLVAGLLFIFAFCFVGFGFILKSKLRR